MTDGIGDGWHGATTLLAWTLGALPALFLLGCILAAIVVATLALNEWAQHRVAVHRFRRNARRSGRKVVI